MTLPNFTLNNERHEFGHAPVYRISREPLSTDIKDPKVNKYYVTPSFWEVGKNPTTGVEGDLWYLAKIVANVATWVKLGGVAGDLLTLTGDTGGVVNADSDGNIDVQGDNTQLALQVNGTPASNLLEYKLIKPAVDGQLAIGHTANAEPSFATLTAGTGISIVNGAGSITISSSGMGSNYWNLVTDATQQMAVNQGYVGNRGTAITYTLPDTAAFGDTVEMTNIGAGLPVIAQNAGDTINIVNSQTTTGVGGSLTATDQYSWIKILCVVANTDWQVIGHSGCWTFV